MNEKNDIVSEVLLLIFVLINSRHAKQKATMTRSVTEFERVRKQKPYKGARTTEE